MDVKKVVLFSDPAGGQNKNRNFIAMLWIAVNKFSLEEIKPISFVRGHSKNKKRLCMLL